MKNDAFFPQDQNGNFINQSSLDKINPDYLPLINEIKKTYLQYLTGKIHSIYLFGSVATGKAIKNSSDIDTLVVLKVEDNFEWANKVQFDLLKKYPFVSNIQFDYANLAELTEKKLFSWPIFLLTTSGLCIYGNNLIPTLPQVKPSIALANSELIQLKDNIKEALKEINNTKSKEKTNYWCKRIMKNLIRDGFFLSMHKENKLTTNIEACAELFIKHYPSKSYEINKTLEYINFPIDDKLIITQHLNVFGKWLTKETNNWLNKFNPIHKNQLEVT